MANETKILIVEDEKPLLDVLSDVLKENGCTVISAQDGEEGLKTALAEHPDLILLDIIMPVMDGLEMLKEMRKDDWGKQADVMLLTNVSDNEKLAEALEVGAFDYLVKSDHTIESIASAVKEKLAEIKAA